MTDITSLPDKWREQDERAMCASELPTPTYCANALEAALPQWQRITDDPETWPEDRSDVFIRSWQWCGVHQWRDAEFDDFRQDIPAHWRQLCDLDYPPENDHD